MRNSNELIDHIHEIGRLKSTKNFSKLFILSILAGMFIALGAIFYTVVTSYGGEGALHKLLGGLAFSTGLILVVVAGAELFTGNNLMIVPFLNKKIKLYDLMRNWFIVYLGNFVGSIIIVILFFYTELHQSGSAEIGKRVLDIAYAKTGLSFLSAFTRGILCNILVCLAIWMTITAKSVSGKILSIIFPITAFVAIGFEHSVANMYFIPMGIMVKNFSSPELFGTTNILNFLTKNLIPVTFGNIIGGSFFVGMAYWFVYKKDKSE